MRQRPHRLANLVYAWCLERVNPEKLDDWKAEMVDLLPWQDVQSETATNLESDSFFDMQSKGR